MQYVLVSACLLGHAVRYDGLDNASQHPVLLQWLQEGRVLPFCPEVSGGLPTPRPAAEIEAAESALEGLGAAQPALGGGEGVLKGARRVITLQGDDVSQAFVHGAQQGLALAQARGIRLAVMKDGSPSCGSTRIYDGSFASVRIPGAGVAAALQRSAGIEVFAETQWDLAKAALDRLETLDGEVSQRSDTGESTS
ncbi:DUF523 domain-containing protein [Paucibacter sp. Y2R2-4]|uniref:DUF523 domain-containing protein n=1 Tax=Paucibacter sp. Y2R2-4 TaxID=2893553 RepID=UPI0021E415C2|nr:DUF523 domain-containing protein [Paucibacter sp. Y2R2-4]MCV2351941.1 DUF523 domain-containing protein [Paucibacter sp. Y2R2-4]